VGYSDENDDGIIDYGELQLGDTAVYIGAQEPRYSAGIHSTLSLLRNTLTLNADFSLTDGMTQTLAYATSSGTIQYVRGAVDPTAPLSEQAGAQAAAHGVVSPFMLPVSTVRLQSVAVNYRLPTSIASLVRAQAMSVALQGTNVGLWTGYHGKDPDVGATPSTSYVSDAGQLPQPRTWQLRVNVAY
jgi:hypothetical protein